MRIQILIAMGFFAAVAALYGQSRVEYGGAAYQFTTVTGVEGKGFGIGSIGGQVVTGKPFSAIEERHSTQVLGDGTHIQNGETNHLYRDEQGRTRIERDGGNISIFDPVSGFSAELNPATKTMSKLAVTVRDGRIVAKLAYTVNASGNLEDLKSKLAKLQAEMSLMKSAETPYRQTLDSESPQIRQLKAQIADLQKAIASAPASNSFYYVPSPSAGNAAIATQPPLELLKKQLDEAQAGGQRTLSVVTADAPTTLRVATGGDGLVESLPSQMINGALAQGTRTTETIPVGKIGNDRPITIVNERWFSHDLQMLVKSTSSDPRFGDTTYQLTGIVQASPDPSLFQIPADYTIRK